MSDIAGRRDQVLRLIRRSRVPLDDDQIAQAVPMNRVYVNTICRQLSRDGLITRTRGGAGKIVNAPAVPDGRAQPGENPPGHAPAAAGRGGTRRREAGWLAGRIEGLVAGFAGCVALFEARQAFAGPSLYFHLCALQRRREHQTASSLLGDSLFLDYAYAVLPAWGMHRMGPQAAKVSDLAPITAALEEALPALEQLWPLRITTLSGRESREAAAIAWNVIAGLKVSTSRTQVVAGSKFLHHLLPDLVPPIDRQYTFTFFTGQKQVPSDRDAFLDWFPQLAAIGAACRDPIQAAITRGGFMATGQAKVIDNAIMGYMQQPRPGTDGTPPASGSPSGGVRR